MWQCGSGVAALGLACLLLASIAICTPAGAQSWQAQSWQPQTWQADSAQSVVARSIEVSGNSEETLVQIVLSKPVETRVFALPTPDRLIVDAPDVVFALPPGTGAAGNGLVTRFRFGSLAPGRARMVFDLAAAVDVSKSMERSFLGNDSKLVLRLTPSLGGSAAVPEASPVTLKPSLAPPAALRERSDSRPVVVIDAGHGGLDPGAPGVGGVFEKDIVLSVALRLADALRSDDRLRVVSTRVDDVFLSLDERVTVAEKVEADLFLSLHADAVGDSANAAHVRGATVYTLSERASDKYAQMLADSENAADARGGIDVRGDDQAGAVRSILFDLIRRESANGSARFREVAVAELGKSIALSRSPRRSAAFRVLKQIGTPAVLVELGYMSNPEDQGLMQTADWQAQVAGALARAVKIHLGLARAKR